MHAPFAPRSRGPLSQHLLDHLVRSPHPIPTPPPATSADDAQLALYVCYELHYRGFDGVDPDWEWEPSLLTIRASLERHFEAELRLQTEPADGETDVVTALQEMATAGGGPSLSKWMATHGERQHMEEFAIHRSAYQLKEADPHSWGLPRLSGRAKSALVEIQADEYGEGRPGQAHAELFAATIRGLDLDDTYGAYLDLIPGVTLATVNLVSMFGLHRRLRGALVGHLALFEMTSIGPMGRYSEALARMGAGADARVFYDVHVEADQHHQVVAAHDLAGGLVADEPELAAEVLFGARAVSRVEAAFTAHLLSCWEKGDTSLLTASRPAHAA